MNTFAGSNIPVKAAKKELHHNIKAANSVISERQALHLEHDDILDQAVQTRDQCTDYLHLLEPYRKGTLANVTTQAQERAAAPAPDQSRLGRLATGVAAVGLGTFALGCVVGVGALAASLVLSPAVLPPLAFAVGHTAMLGGLGGLGSGVGGAVVAQADEAVQGSRIERQKEAREQIPNRVPELGSLLTRVQQMEGGEAKRGGVVSMSDLDLKPDRWLLTQG